MIHKEIPVFNATLTTYILDNYERIDSTRIRPAIVICPGGAYELISDTEAEAIAVKMLNFGFQAFVLRYSVAPSTYPTALKELAASLQMIRKNKTDWHIDPDKIIVAGFSAGGHLAASLGTFWQEKLFQAELGGVNEDWKPNGLLLCYPVITSGPFAHQTSIPSLLGDDFSKLKERMSLENQVTNLTPPTFIWHTVTDASVPVENTMLFAQSLQKNGVPFEMHIFPKGAHGLSLATAESTDDPEKQMPAVAVWPELFKTWIENNF